ncbi:MAG: sirohydrochlorin chelatase [Nitrospiria bacterium]
MSKKSGVVIVLAMHGTPPRDFPKEERKELFELRARLKHVERLEAALIARRDFLERKMRAWPRTKENDAFHFGSMELGADLSSQSGWPVVVGFNEFCDPDLDKAIGDAVHLTTGKVVVTTPMMTRGGGHSKGDIPEAIRRVQQQHPDTEIVYAWPFPVPAIAKFLSDQIQAFL